MDYAAGADCQHSSYCVGVTTTVSCTTLLIPCGMCCVKGPKDSVVTALACHGSTVKIRYDTHQQHMSIDDLVEYHRLWRHHQHSYHSVVQRMFDHIMHQKHQMYGMNIHVQIHTLVCSCVQCFLCLFQFIQQLYYYECRT